MKDSPVMMILLVVLRQKTRRLFLLNLLKRVAQGKLLFEKVAEMYRLSDRVTLLCPREIHASVDALTRYYGTDIAARAQKAPKPSDDEWRTIRAGAAPLYMKFMMQARNDLGVHEPLYSIDELVNRLSKK